MSAAIDSHIMSASDKPGGQMFGEGFKATVAGRNSAGSEDSDTHTLNVVSEPRDGYKYLPGLRCATRRVSRKLLSAARS